MDLPITKKWVTKKQEGAITLKHFLYSLGSACVASIIGLLFFGGAMFMGVAFGSATALITLVYWTYILFIMLGRRATGAFGLTIHFFIKLLLTVGFMYIGLIVLGASGVGFLLGFLIVLTVFSCLIIKEAAPRRKTVLSRNEWLRDF